jgi:hypothetical protein
MLPQRFRYGHGINLFAPPPGAFVPDPVELSVMRPAQRDCELVAHLAPSARGWAKRRRARRPAARQAPAVWRGSACLKFSSLPRLLPILRGLMLVPLRQGGESLRPPEGSSAGIDMLSQSPDRATKAASTARLNSSTSR